MDGNPILLIDPNGDDTIINENLEVLEPPTEPNDTKISMRKGNELVPYGDFNDIIDITEEFDELLIKKLIGLL